MSATVRYDCDTCGYVDEVDLPSVLICESFLREKGWSVWTSHDSRGDDHMCPSCYAKWKEKAVKK